MSVHRILDGPGLARRLLEGSEWSGDCLLWQRGKLANGYGTIYFQGGTEYVHVLAWMLRLGPTSGPAAYDGMRLIGRCPHRHCLNPEHWTAVPRRGCRDVVERDGITHSQRMYGIWERRTQAERDEITGPMVEAYGGRRWGAPV